MIKTKTRALQRFRNRPKSYMVRNWAYWGPRRAEMIQAKTDFDLAMKQNLGHIGLMNAYMNYLGATSGRWEDLFS